MLTNILIALAVILVLGFLFVATRTNDFRIERKATIAAPPSAIFPLVNDFQQWQTWSPWEKIDPALKRTFSGSPAGVGSVYDWLGNNEVGEGRMTITESKSNEYIRVKMEFLKPFKGLGTTEFVFTPNANGTTVAWSMTGEKGLLGKFMHLVMDMDKMIGGNYDKGLADLKILSEQISA